MIRQERDEAYSYDGNGRVVQVVQNGKTTDYSYDGVGNRASMITPEGEAVQYSYDDVNLMTGVHLSDGKGITYSYDSLNRVARKDYTGGTYSTYEYDAKGRPTLIDHLKRDGSAIYSQANVYDAVGNILTKTTGLGPTTYAYDDTYRLTGADHPTQSDEILSYDAAGNRLSSADYSDWSYNNRNQLLGYDAVYYSYDANGNTRTKYDAAGTTEFSYDYENRLIRMLFPNGSYAEYKYDVLGRRIEKDNDQTVSGYVYDGYWLLAEYSDTSELNRTYFNGMADNNPSFWKDFNGAFFFFHDHLETPQTIVDESATVAWENIYTGFGQAAISLESAKNNIRFPGQYYDHESGIHYNYYRDYFASVGRYLESDPLGVVAGLNLYSYSDNNPIKYSDPLGLWVKRCSRGLGGKDEPKKLKYNPLRHDYLNVSGTFIGFQAGDNPIWSQGRVKQGRGIEYDSGRCHTMVCGDDRFDKYVLAEATYTPKYCVIAYPGTTPHLLGARN